MWGGMEKGRRLGGGHRDKKGMGGKEIPTTVPSIQGKTNLKSSSPGSLGDFTKQSFTTKKPRQSHRGLGPISAGRDRKTSHGDQNRAIATFTRIDTPHNEDVCCGKKIREMVGKIGGGIEQRKDDLGMNEPATWESLAGKRKGGVGGFFFD